MKMNSRTIMRIAAVVILVAVFGWQWWGKHRAKSVDATTATASAPVRLREGTGLPSLIYRSLRVPSGAASRKSSACARRSLVS